jgi:hypothetical protein
MAADTTVEFGDDERRVRLIDRLFGDPATDAERRLSVPAVACAVIAVVLFAVAEAMPWITVRSVSLPSEASVSLVISSSHRDSSIEAIGNGTVFAYYVGLVLLLMVLGAALVSRPHARRVLSAAGFGLAAGLLIVVIGLIGKANHGGEQAGIYIVDSVAENGPYVAIAAVVAAVAALALSGWHPHRPVRRRKPAETVVDEDDPDVEPGPIDLTVTSA